MPALHSCALAISEKASPERLDFGQSGPCSEFCLLAASEILPPVACILGSSLTDPLLFLCLLFRSHISLSLSFSHTYSPSLHLRLSHTRFCLLQLFSFYHIFYRSTTILFHPFLTFVSQATRNMRTFLAVTLALALVLAVIQPAVSVPALTAPVSSTKGHGGKLLSVKWKDNGNSPKISTWKGVNIFLATGSTNVQYKLQQLASNISTHKTHGKYAVDASIGPNGGYYFIRMESVSTNSAGIPDMAFSAKFTLDNMTGKFNSTVMSQASSGTLGGSSSSSATGAAGSASTSTLKTTFTHATAAQVSSPSASSDASESAASSSTTSGAASAQVQQLILIFGLASAAVAGLVVLV